MKLNEMILAFLLPTIIAVCAVFINKVLAIIRFILKGSDIEVENTEEKSESLEDDKLLNHQALCGLYNQDDDESSWDDYATDYSEYAYEYDDDDEYDEYNKYYDEYDDEYFNEDYDDEFEYEYEIKLEKKNNEPVVDFKQYYSSIIR